jgi:hypothetical protein
MRSSVLSCISALLFLTVVPAFVLAQDAPVPPGTVQVPAPGSADPVGVRAAGMGRAFTAVADDASAVYWNPAGLGSGAFLSLVLDRNVLDQSSATLVALAASPLGFAYYRTATAPLEKGQDTLVTHHTGVTIVQGLGSSSVVVGGTLKWVHGDASGVSSNKFDMDVGIKATGGLASVGLSVRNVLQPEFDAPGRTIRLDRAVRAGVSFHLRKDTSVAADVDLTKSVTALGNWREIAVGVENQLSRKASTRAGVHWNSAGGNAGAAPIGTVGASYSIYGSALADVQYSYGSDHGDRGWGAGLRFVF